MRHVHRFGLCLIRTSAVQNRIKTIFDSLFLLLPARLEAVAATTQIILLLRRSIFYIFAHKFISYKWTAYVTRTTKHYVQDFPYKRTIGLYVESWTSWRATWLKNVAVDVTSMRSCYGGKSYGGRGGLSSSKSKYFQKRDSVLRSSRGFVEGCTHYMQKNVAHSPRSNRSTIPAI